MIAGPPPPDTPVPAAVRALAGADVPHPVWRNELGGLTWRLGGRFVKWQPAGGPLDLAAEAERLAWAGRYVTVPRVLDRGGDEQGSWLLTAAVAGESAVAPRWRSDPARAVAAIGAGLRVWHDTLPVDGCPYRWRPGGDADPPPVPAADRVVCHGDACAPNTLIAADGRCAGHVDVGALGVGDRWADLAIATWSSVWNYGPGWERPLLAAYGIAPDPDRTHHYRRLWGSDPMAPA